MKAKMRLGEPQPPLPRWSYLNEASTSRACCAQPVSPVRSAGHGDGPGRRCPLRALRIAAAPVRQLPGRGRTLRPLLRVLRSRDGARREPPNLVEAVAAGGAGAACGRIDLWNRPGGPTSCQVGTSVAGLAGVLGSLPYL